MNTLSWLIYAAEVFGRLGFASLIGGGAIIAVCVFTFVMSVDLPYVSEYGKDREAIIASLKAERAEWRKKATYGLCAAFLLFVLAIAAPSSRTIYMIAASEAGEAVVTSPDAIEMMGDLKAIIKKRLKEELGE